jgi:hypothetical protein
MWTYCKVPMGSTFYNKNYFLVGHDLRPPEPIRRPYRRRSQSELFAPLVPTPETAAATALAATALLAADNDAKPLLVDGQAILTNGDVLPPNGGGGINPVGGAAANSDTDPDKKGRSFGEPL